MQQQQKKPEDGGDEFFFAIDHAVIDALIYAGDRGKVEIAKEIIAKHLRHVADEVEQGGYDENAAATKARRRCK